MNRLTRPLTPMEGRRIRLHIALIPLYVWLILTWTGYARSVSTPGRLDNAGLIKGHDFAHFYVLGEIASERRPRELYSYADQAIRSDRLAGYWDRYLPTHGPQLSLVFAPLALLPYEAAWIVWSLISAMLYAGCCYALWRTEPALRRYRWPVSIAVAAYPVFAMLIAYGQTSSLGLASFTLAYLAFRADRPWLAGLALGCVFYKPPLGVVLPFVLAYGRQWRVILGAFIAVVFQLAVAWAYFGHGVLIEYFQVVMQFGQVAGELEPQPHQMQSLRSFFSILLPWPALARICYVVAALAVAVAAARCWRTAAPLQLRYAVLLLAAILVDPHVNVYDLVVIAPVFMLVSAWAIERGKTGWPFWSLLYFCYYVPTFGHVVSATATVQISVLGLVALMVTLVRAAGLAASGKTGLSRPADK